VLVNKAAFDALDKPTQDAVLKAAADAETRGWPPARRPTPTRWTSSRPTA
jgi:TRAP-type C4-dicarboxylate transport system substrate-binding protein